MKYFILISIFIMLMCCTINCVTATEMNNTINHNVFINNISDVINEIDYNNPITNHGEYIQSHINYIDNLTNNFKLLCSLNPNEKKFNLTNNINNSSNIHHNKSNLVNLSTDKNKHGIVLFNDTLHNQNQYNKSCKLLGLNNSVNNDSIFKDKELNISKSNSNMCDDSSEDNFLINPVPESDNKDYNIMLLIPLLLVVLGAIILYKKKMR